ncbi:hypothetical protein OF83DRAFT_261848 [Amylostereum chailletii]|nr:hypothetical protein OF83DRAFT_261848 [Amylostereum chailletii]
MAKASLNMDVLFIISSFIDTATLSSLLRTSVAHYESRLLLVLCRPVSINRLPSLDSFSQFIASNSLYAHVCELYLAIVGPFKPRTGDVCWDTGAKEHLVSFIGVLGKLSHVHTVLLHTTQSVLELRPSLSEALSNLPGLRRLSVRNHFCGEDVEHLRLVRHQRSAVLEELHISFKFTGTPTADLNPHLNNINTTLKGLRISGTSIHRHHVILPQLRYLIVSDTMAPIIGPLISSCPSLLHLRLYFLTVERSTSKRITNRQTQETVRWPRLASLSGDVSSLHTCAIVCSVKRLHIMEELSFGSMGRVQDIVYDVRPHSLGFALEPYYATRPLPRMSNIRVSALTISIDFSTTSVNTARLERKMGEAWDLLASLSPSCLRFQVSCDHRTLESISPLWLASLLAAGAPCLTHIFIDIADTFTPYLITRRENGKDMQAVEVLDMDIANAKMREEGLVDPLLDKFPDGKVLTSTHRVPPPARFILNRWVSKHCRM